MRCVPAHASRRTPLHLAPVAGEVFLRRNHPVHTQPARPDAVQPPGRPRPNAPLAHLPPHPAAAVRSKGYAAAVELIDGISGRHALRPPLGRGCVDVPTMQ